VLAEGLGEHRDERIADDDDVVVADRTADQRLAVTRGAGIDLLLLDVERALPACVAAEHRVQLPSEVTRRPSAAMSRRPLATAPAPPRRDRSASAADRRSGTAHHTVRPASPSIASLRARSRRRMS
jgi:hypothetical protein